jgi:hypothetical protein
MTFPNPPSAKEIERAREIVTKQLGQPDSSSDWFEPMDEWQGAGWHVCEIYFGILIGLQIAKSRIDRREKKNAKEKNKT